MKKKIIGERMNKNRISTKEKENCEGEERMKEIIQREMSRFSCDNCNFYMDFDTYELFCGYGSNLDGNSFHFCSTKCMQEFIDREIKDASSTKNEVNSHQPSPNSVKENVFEGAINQDKIATDDIHSQTSRTKVLEGHQDALHLEIKKEIDVDYDKIRI